MKNLLIVLLISLMPICYGAKYAIIKNAKVINIIEADATNAANIASGMGATAVQSNTASIGQNCVNGVFSNPAPAVIPDSPSVAALKATLAAEIASLNTAYPALGLIASDVTNQDGTVTKADTLTTAIPKLFAAGVSKADANYLFTLYGAIKEAQAQK